MSFFSNMLNRVSDGTQDGDLGVIPWSGASDAVYLVQFIGNTECDRDPSANDDWMTIEEAQEVCRQYKCNATLFDCSGQFQQGFVSPTGDYQLN